MNYFDDKKIRKIVKDENIKIPKDYNLKIEEALNNLPEIEDEKLENNNNNEINDRKIRLPKIPKYAFNICLAACVFTVVILPNVSKKACYALEQVPVLGSIVKVVTISNYFEEDGLTDIELSVPKVENDDNSKSEANEKINDEVNELKDKIIRKYNEEKDPELHLSTSLSNEVIQNSKDWFTLKLTITESAGSTDVVYKYYNVYKPEDRIINIKDMFINDEYKKILSEEIKRQMIERMNNDESVIYWLDEEQDKWSFREIDDDQNYYFSKDNNLVIVFDKYEVGPGSVGTPEFEIPKELYLKFLKKDI